VAVQAISDFANNPVKLRLAGMQSAQAEPAIAKLVADVDPAEVKQHDVHLSSYHTRLAISTGGTRPLPLSPCRVPRRAIAH
jgi:hypothetical protein